METKNSLAAVNDDLPFEDREVLEHLALEQVCACLYYDLADCIDESSDEELIAIVDGTSRCDVCGAN